MKRPVRARRIASLPAMLLLSAATTLAQSSAVVYTEVTAEAGVALADLLTESVAWGDYHNDGDQDLYLTNDGPNRLFRNDGNDQFTDVTTEAGVGNAGFSVGSVFGDLDNDGDLDLYVVNFGTGLDALFRNDGPSGPGGTYRFTDVTVAAGLIEERSSRGIALIEAYSKHHLRGELTPLPGSGLWYLLREVTAAGAGTFDEPSGSQTGSRDDGIAASPGACL